MPTAGSGPGLRDTRCSTIRAACELASLSACHSAHAGSSAVMAAKRRRVRADAKLTVTPRVYGHTSLRSAARPLTSGGRKCGLTDLIDGLSRESEEGMWYGSRSSDLGTKPRCPRNC